MSFIIKFERDRCYGIVTIQNLKKTVFVFAVSSVGILMPLKCTLQACYYIYCESLYVSGYVCEHY